MSEQNKLSRRQFLGGMAVGLAAAGLSGCGVNVRSNSNESQNTAPTNSGPASSQSSSASSAVANDSLLAVSGTDPAALIEKGLSELGGIGRFVKNGNTVVIKANFSVPRKPGEAATTDPNWVAAVVKQCLSAGAIAKVPVENVNMGKATIDQSRCLAWSQGKDCFICGEQCLRVAISIEGENKPVVQTDLCVGCGTCERNCHVNGIAAIQVTPR